MKTATPSRHALTNPFELAFQVQLFCGGTGAHRTNLAKPRMDQKKSLKYCIDVIGAQDANGNLEITFSGFLGNGPEVVRVFFWRFSDPLNTLQHVSVGSGTGYLINYDTLPSTPKQRRICVIPGLCHFYSNRGGGKQQVMFKLFHASWRACG